MRCSIDITKAAAKWVVQLQDPNSLVRSILSTYLFYNKHGINFNALAMYCVLICKGRPTSEASILKKVIYGDNIGGWIPKNGDVKEKYKMLCYFSTIMCFTLTDSNEKLFKLGRLEDLIEDVFDEIIRDANTQIFGTLPRLMTDVWITKLITTVPFIFESFDLRHHIFDKLGVSIPRRRAV